jgi:hypothetical protein
MSEIKVNKISPRTACGTTTLGDSGDTFTIPAGVSITNSGTASGFGSTGEVSWNTTVKTSTFTVTAGEGFFCNTTGGAFTANLPAGTAGNSFAISDYAATFQTNNLTISPNGSQKIGGVNADVVLNTEGQAVYFVYIDDTQGWINVIDSTSNERANAFVVATGGTITTCGNDKIHTFTGPGTFTVTATAACAANNVMSHLVVAGGGGGSTFGGGGAGGFREVKSPVTPYTASPLDGYPSAPNRITVTSQAYPITVGGGGAGGPGSPGGGSNGNPSIFSTITSTAGGGGNQDVPSNSTNPGGSGGGNQAPGTPGGSGNTPPVSPPQGNNGGTGIGGLGCSGGGGGGGATAVGTNATPGSQGASGNGGAGATTSINGSPVAYAGGGGGGGDARAPGVTGGGGGTGGGGNGSGGGSNPGGVAGTTNRGGGGGAAGFQPTYNTGASGGSGIVIIRYKFQ